MACCGKLPADILRRWNAETKWAWYCVGKFPRPVLARLVLVTVLMLSILQPFLPVTHLQGSGACPHPVVHKFFKPRST